MARTTRETMLKQIAWEHFHQNNSRYHLSLSLSLTHSLFLPTLTFLLIVTHTLSHFPSPSLLSSTSLSLSLSLSLACFYPKLVRSIPLSCSPPPISIPTYIALILSVMGSSLQSCSRQHLMRKMLISNLIGFEVNKSWSWRLFERLGFIRNSYLQVSLMSNLDHP